MNSTSVISKTQQYRKVMKPMLERKRRARINNSLDQLKDLIIECMKEDDEHILKLEKADILEHTVEYLYKIKNNDKNKNFNKMQQQQQHEQEQDEENYNNIKESFRNGYIHAANEISKILATTRGVNTNFGIKLMSHLGYKLNTLSTKQQTVVPAAVAAAAPQTLKCNGLNKNQQEKNIKPFNEITNQQSYYYQDQESYKQQYLRSFSPMSINVSALSPVSSGYHSNLSSPVPSETDSIISNDYHQYQNHITNINNLNNKENVWRPW